MKLLFAVTFTSVYALSVRLLFGFFDNILSIMGITFLILVPACIGFVTVLLSGKKIKNRLSAFFTPWITSSFLLIITILLNLEGIICWIMMFPLFAVLSGFGGITAYEINKKQMRSEREKTLDISLAFLIPLLIGYIEGDRSLTPETLTVKEEITIQAGSDKIWRHIINVNIDNDRETRSLSETLGFPKHLYTTLDTAAVGGKRIAYYSKGLFFEETITDLIKEKKLVLEITTYPKKIPPTVMDEHILIGGEHLDILEDVYQLEPLKNGKIKVSLSSEFYINTPFNWYSKLWAKMLMTDMLNQQLKRIKRQSTTSNAEHKK